MKNKTLHLVLFAILGLTGCGSDRNDTGTPPSNAPPLTNLPLGEPSDGTPTGDYPPAEQPTAEEPVDEAGEPVPALILDPEVAAEGVAPNGKIVLIADRPLNAASVETSIELRDAETTERIPAEVEYDADQQRITITPARLLEAGKHYRVRTSQVRDLEGNVIGMNGRAVAKVKMRIYKRTIIYKANGDVNFYTVFNRVPGTSESMDTFYSGPGSDQAWFQGEDEVSYYETTQHLPGVEVTRKYEDPGEGSIWFDGNDVLTRITRRTYDDAYRLLEEFVVADAGDDGDLFTEDDDYVWAMFKIYDDAERLLYDISIYEGLTELTPGEDGRWLTNDDQPFSYTRYEYDQLGRRSREYSTTRSEGNEPFGENDRITSYSHYMYDENGQLAEIIPYSCDTACFDGNDRTGLFTRFQRGGTTVVEELVGAGTNGRADSEDELIEYQYREYDEQGRVAYTGFFDERGGDQTWHTADDFAATGGGGSMYVYETDAFGHLKRLEMTLSGNGMDLKRFSGDEEVTFMQIYTYDETSQLNHLRSFSGPGPTPGWFDGDEVLFGETEYLDTEE